MSKTVDKQLYVPNPTETQTTAQYRLIMVKCNYTNELSFSGKAKKWSMTLRQKKHAGKIGPKRGRFVQTILIGLAHVWESKWPPVG